MPKSFLYALALLASCACVSAGTLNTTERYPVTEIKSLGCTLAVEVVKTSYPDMNSSYKYIMISVAEHYSYPGDVQVGTFDPSSITEITATLDSMLQKVKRDSLQVPPYKDYSYSEGKLTFSIYYLDGVYRGCVTAGDVIKNTIWLSLTEFETLSKHLLRALEIAAKM
ncbi:MAG TPA: hypothetical protein PLG20_07320 [Candidatus Syntrophosphaera sp.]|jgi:hypothetical protein|nr:hypothetical protein [Candidatus Syntrophosphaera sp.]